MDQLFTGGITTTIENNVIVLYFKRSVIIQNTPMFSPKAVTNGTSFMITVPNGMEF